MAVDCDSVPLRLPFKTSIVTARLLTMLLYWSASFTVTGGVNTAPAVVTEGASCRKARDNVAGVMNTILLVEVRPMDEAITRLLPALVMTRSPMVAEPVGSVLDRKSTRLNSSHRCISYA